MNIIDQETIDSLLELDPAGAKELLEELLGMFTSMTPPRIQIVRDAYSKQDAATIARECHSLKSSSGNLGAKRFSQLCAKIEGITKVGSVAGLENMMSELDPAYQEAAAALQQIVASLK